MSLPNGKLQELFNEGTHIHVASCNRKLLRELARIGHERYGLSIREFPPYDTVDCVHVSGSFHYRRRGQCHNTGAQCPPPSQRSEIHNLAFDASGPRQADFHRALTRKYGTPS